MGKRMKMTARAERDGLYEFTRRGYPTRSHTLFSSAAPPTTTTTILGIRYAGPPSSRADKQFRYFRGVRAPATGTHQITLTWKNYTATHRSSLSRGTAGEVGKGPNRENRMHLSRSFRVSCEQTVDDSSSRNSDENSSGRGKQIFCRVFTFFVINLSQR